ncbi:L-aminoadipate-semialdehyde dehydrogenase [Pseudozyma hubeiensis SY62]|uniref:L-aminoadipate-semialdehyde dehydrogenase n=1 Tax=Pseudozyma hubeiensis (strain SY62) TaxID=1305764 RepID=R9PF33_PSEHS|nr:L-aminoadipate-semialdehyde dehydrogenase [Pseudozyma hubeiensis SY62]GAC96705.1 L-aminoadipate-semialdehyde dehydrogenase [Pseudozyma hubeiensis SY62]
MQGHTSHDQDSIDKLVSIAGSKAIFGSTSPRKNRSAGMRSSTESTRSLASSSSSVRSPRTPLTPMFSHPEHDVTKTPTLSTIDLPAVVEVPRLRRPHFSRIVSEEIQYIGRSSDVPVSEEGHEERASSIKRSSSTASSKSRTSASRFSTWNGRDGLMLAMDELEQELARTMVTLSASANNTPVSTISRARGKSMRRPHTADKVQGLSSARSLPIGLAQADGSSSAVSAYQSQFQRESWMSSHSDEDVLSYSSRPIRFSASDLTLPSDSLDHSKRSDVDADSSASWSARPVSQVSIASSVSKRSSGADIDSLPVPALVFDGRSSGSSTASGEALFPEAPSRRDSFVTAETGHSFQRLSSLIKRPSTLRVPSGNKSGLYQLQKGARSTPSLASREPPRDPLPPLPSMPVGLSQLLQVGGAIRPPRPTRSPARSSTSSRRNSNVSHTDKPLPALPC